MRIVEWCKYDSTSPLPPELVEEGKKITIDALRRTNFHFDSYYYREGEYGCPRFDNGHYLIISPEEWGELMATAFPDEFMDPYSPDNFWIWKIGPMKRDLINQTYVKAEERYHYPEPEEARCGA